MLHKTRNLVKDWRAGDAQKLAKLHTATAPAWPGGHGGAQITARDEERGIRESDLTGAFVTEDGGKIVSICTVVAKPGQNDCRYIGWLDCHPAYHGKKHGKSVLRAAVEQACEDGCKRVDLHTWPGNLKAVPLYKKMGFMWRPETGVHMENFVPAAHNYPLAAGYFARHDWYDTLARSLELREDLVTKGKVRVYEYVWRAEDGDYLRMVFDRRSWGVVEVENNDLLVSCSIPGEKLVAGIPHPIRWRIVNKKPGTAHVVLNASGDPGVAVSKQEVLKVRDSAAVDGTFVIDPDIPEKTKAPEAAILRTQLTINGVSMELAAGVDVQQAVSVWVDEHHSIVVPGRRRNLVLALRSNLDKKSTVRVSVAPAGGAIVHRRRHKVVLGPKKGAELSVPVEATGPGPVALDVHASAATGKRSIPVKTKRIDLLAAEPESVAAGLGKDTAILHGSSLTAFAEMRRGGVSVYHRLRAERAHRLSITAPTLGPPFSWWSFADEKVETSVEQDAEGAAVRLRMKSSQYPGLVLNRRVLLDQGPLVKVVDTFVNGSARPVKFALQHQVRMDLGERFELVAPLKNGIYRSASGTGGRGLDRIRIPEEASEWSENWFCIQREDGCAAGVIWKHAETVSAGLWRTGVRSRTEVVSPGQSKTFDPVFYFAGDGNWQTVRSWWRTLFGGGAPETETARSDTLEPIELTIRPDPLILKGGKGTASVALRSIGEHKLNGKVVLELPAGVRSSSRRFDVSNLSVKHSVSRKIRLASKRNAPPGPEKMAVSFETDEAVYRAESSVLILPRRAPAVRVSRKGGGGVIAVSNGVLTVKVAPEFMGCVVSLERDGREFLNSAYPKARVRGWENRWHGGIAPEYNRGWGGLKDHKEKFRDRVVGRKGKQGLVWRGVRVTCVLKQEHLRGQSIALEYLLTPGVGVLAVLASCRDTSGVSSTGRMGFSVCPSFAKSPGDAWFYNPTAEHVTALAAPYHSESVRWDWGAIVGKKGQAIFLSANGEGARAGGTATGDEGCTLSAGVRRPMPPNGKVEALFFVAPVFGVEDAKAHSPWSRFTELP